LFGVFGGMLILQFLREEQLSRGEPGKLVHELLYFLYAALIRGSLAE